MVQDKQEAKNIAKLETQLDFVKNWLKKYENDITRLMSDYAIDKLSAQEEIKKYLNLLPTINQEIAQAKAIRDGVLNGK